MNSKWLKNIITFIIVIGLMLFFPSLIYLLFIKLGINETLSNMLANLVYCIALVIFYYKDIKKEFIIFKNNPTKTISSSFKFWLIGFGVMAVSNLIINLLVFKGNIASNETQVRSMLLSYPLIGFISAVIIAPITEELVFRKALKNIFNNPIIYFTISGVLFGFMHCVADLSSALNLLYIIPYGALGFCFACTYNKTNTIFSSILAHAFHNFITFSLIMSLAEYI